MDIRGVHYTYAPLLIGSGIFEDENCTGYSDFEFSDTTDDSEKHERFPLVLIENISTDDESSDEMNKVITKRKKEQCRVKSATNCIMNMCSDEGSSDEKHNRILVSRKRGYDCHNTYIPITHMKKEKEELRNIDEHFVKKRKVQCCETIKDGERCENGSDIERTKSDDDCISISSSQSSYYPTYQETKQSSTTVTYKYENITIEGELPSSQLFGQYFCKICNLSLSSEKVLHDHMTGKRHLKNLKLKNVDLAVYQAIPASALTEGQSKYPKSPQGIIRKKSRQRAKIQDVIRNEVKKPCPGLHLVTEIQGIHETQYYCSICNTVCSPNSIIPHLTGFKHQLNSVKYFRPGDYERMTNERKNLIHDSILSILRAIQKKEGLGRMTVEIEEIASDTANELVPYMSQPSTSTDVRETSLKDSGMSLIEYYDRATIPDKSAADFYCEHCDAHMNSEEMWQSHIIGKRHINNLKKLPGARPSKCKTIPINARAKLLDRFEDEYPEEPIVGLNDVREIQIPETKSVSYNCYLCCSCHTSMDIVEHIISLKHRKRYLDHIRYDYMQFISGMSELSSTSIIRSICAQMEDERGRGNPKVHINKSAFNP